MRDIGEHHYRYSDLHDLKALGQFRPVKSRFKVYLCSRNEIVTFFFVVFAFIQVRCPTTLVA